MKDLVVLYEYVKEQVKDEEEMLQDVNDRKEVREILASVVKGKEYHYTSNKKLLKKMKIYYSKNESGGFLFNSSYRFKLSKTNLNKIQQYIEEEKKQWY